MVAVAGSPSLYLLEGRLYTVGRTAACDVVVQDPTVSRRHAELEQVDAGVRVRDLGSTNGTFLNGERIFDAVATPGARLTFGKADFEVRQAAPTVPLLANLGAVQLNYGYGPAECRQAVEMIGADALVLHLNPLQEAIQPEGQTRFGGLLPRMRQVVEELAVPVVAKEVGCGLSEATARSLAGIGVRILDTAGLGGTSWARIEARRAGRPDLGEVFAGWGIPTPESIRQVRRVPGVTVIGSGGIRSGLDAAKAISGDVPHTFLGR